MHLLVLLLAVASASEAGRCPYAHQEKARVKRQDNPPAPAPPTPAPTPPPTPPPIPPPNKSDKPPDASWIRGHERHQKRGLVQWMLRGCWADENETPPCEPYKFRHVEYPGYDGWYNNPAHPELGAVDTPLLRRTKAYYQDSVYKPVEGRPNPFILSETFMKGDHGTQSRTGKTALLVFFGQQMVEEILDAQRPACPPEYFNIPVPENHEYRKRPRHTEMPLLRTRYDMRTGFSPGNPRQQLNEITPWLDGGLTYGTTKAWADQLRRYANGSIDQNGLLAAANNSWRFPEYNTHRLPLANPPPPALHHRWVKQHETAKVSRFFKLGNPRGNENPFLLTFGVMWFRWHNVIAEELRRQHAHWSSERIFNEARKWVIATHQQVVMNEWLPIWLGRSLSAYPGYDAALDPQIDQFFQSAAMRFGHTLVTPGVYLRDYVRNGCTLINSTNTVRTCNFFWRPQEPMLHELPKGHGHLPGVKIVDIDRLIMGMASQLTEEEDHIIVEDLRGRVFGPLEFSRRDLMAINIQRGRDHGLPDFNTAREAYGLPRIKDENHFQFVKNKTLLGELKRLYNEGQNDSNAWLDRIDVWVGGILETGDAPGELFNTIIRDQFTRIRNADRFWFENARNGLFTLEEIDRIHKIRIRDIIMAVTEMEVDDLQENPFLAPSPNDNVTRFCSTNLKPSVHNPAHLVLPALTKGTVEECVPPNTYDYFSNSETSFVLTFVFLTFVIGGCIALLFIMIHVKERSRIREEILKSERAVPSNIDARPAYSAKEWVGKREGLRFVILQFNKQKQQIEVRAQQGGVLRAVDFRHCSSFKLMMAGDGLHILLRVTNDYDLVLRFESMFLRNNFISALMKDFLGNISIEEIKVTVTELFNQAVTRANRQKRLDMFVRVIYAQALNFEHSQKEILTMDSETGNEILRTEMTMNEFAEALRMQPNSEFVRKMFNLVDKDNNGFISFREFADIMIIFFKGTADDKVALFFNMYDINNTKQLTKRDFVLMIKSLIELVNADVKNQDLENVVNSMMKSAGLINKEAMNFEDFKRLLGGHKDKLDIAQFKVAWIPEAKQAEQSTSRRTSRLTRARDTAISIYGVVDYRQGEHQGAEDERKNALDNQNLVEDKKKQRKQEEVPAWWTKTAHFVENFRLQIFWCTLYTLVLLSIFAERAYYYSVEREHSGLRRIAGYGVTVTRGAASAMMFTYSTLLVTMCRNTITRLRDTILHRYIPFDSAIAMHKYIAAWALFFTVIHTIGHAINFYHISTQTSDDLTCLFRNFFHSTHEIPKFHYWCWQTLTGVTGILLVILTAIIYTFALPYTRAHLYNWFWFTHSLYPVFYLLVILHGAGRLVQPPFFYYFFLGPCILFVLDSLVSISRKRIEIPVIKAELLPSEVTMLAFKRPTDFDYKAGQWIRIACPALNSNEYHPFTISSAPSEPNLTVHIRGVGPWTKNIRSIYDPSVLCDKSLPKILLDGPYGESHQDWNQYEVSVLIGGGIGVTPFASILKDIIHNSESKKLATCKKVYFLWITKTQKHFEWMVDILRELENADKNIVVSVHIFITQFYEKYDLRTVLLYICERHFQRVCGGRSLVTGLKAVTHFGRPDCLKIFRGIRQIHPTVRKIGVFTCGRLALAQQIDRAVVQVNNETHDDMPLYQHHFESFN